MQNTKSALLQKLQSRNAKTAQKSAAQRCTQSHTAAQVKVIVVNNINANIHYVQTQDDSVKFTQLYTRVSDGTYEVAAKYGNSYLRDWLEEEQEDGTIAKTTCMHCVEEELVQTLELLRECVEEGYADNAIAKVQAQNKAAGQTRKARRLQSKRVKVQG